MDHNPNLLYIFLDNVLDNLLDKWQGIYLAKIQFVQQDDKSTNSRCKIQSEQMPERRFQPISCHHHCRRAVATDAEADADAETAETCRDLPRLAETC